MIKSPVTVLQEMMLKCGEVPTYECIAQSGPQHKSTFKYCCKTRGITVTALARSKKEAKHDAAKNMLSELYVRGLPVPAPYSCPPEPSGLENEPAEPTTTKALPSTGEGASTSDSTQSYVALLRELCGQYGAGLPVFDLVGDTGPSHCRQFTISVRLGQHERRATALTKKAGKQLAAEQMYKYLRLNLSRISADFVEEDALARAHEKAMKRYVEVAESTSFRVPLNLKISNYHLGLLMYIDQEKIELGREALTSSNHDDPVRALNSLCGALGLSVTSEQVGGLHVVYVTPTAPAVATAAVTLTDAYAAALRYIKLSVVNRSSENESLEC